MTYTGGPWHVMRRGFDKRQIPVVYAKDSDLRYISWCADSMNARESTDNLANAYLIAAAPDMFEAIQRQVANIEHWLETGEPADSEQSRSIYEQLKAAMNKATNMSPNTGGELSR